MEEVHGEKKEDEEENLDFTEKRISVYRDSIEPIVLCD